jgi:iron complex transport system substrate-binding protein
VKNNRIVVMDAHAMDATMRTVSGIEVLADALVEKGIAR